MRVNSPCRRRNNSTSFRLDLLRLNKHRNDSTSVQTESAVSNNIQDRPDLTRVAGHTDKGIILAARREENLAQHGSAADILGGAGLLGDAVPQLVVLRETVLDAPGREQVLDVGLAVAVVAGVDADALAQEFLDHGLERGGAVGQLQAGEGVVGGLEGTGQRGDIVVVWGVDALLLDLLLPEVVRDEGLVDAVGGQGGVGPGGGAVAVELGPVALNLR